MKKLEHKWMKIAICGCLSVVLCTSHFRSVNAQKYSMVYLYGTGDYSSMINDTRQYNE